MKAKKILFVMNEIILFLTSGHYIPSIFFLIVLAIFIWYAFSIIYHFIRFGIGTTPKIFALIFLVGSFLLFTSVIGAYARVNWSEIAQFILGNLKIY